MNIIHRCRWIAAVAGGALVITAVASPAVASGSEGVPVITSNLREDAWVRPTDRIELRLDEPLPVSAGRLAVFIDQTDWTGMFVGAERSFSYHARPLPLPRGEHSLIVYVVSPDNTWEERARFPLRVLGRGGFERAEATPSFDIVNKGQLAENHSPAGAAPSRDVYQDFTFNTAFKSNLLRRGWTTRNEVAIVGVSHRPEALRFGERGEDAPLVDLSSYLFGAENHRVAMSLGHVTFGSHRHLVSGFASRGGLGTVKLGSRSDVSVAALSGTAIVGWNDPLGFDQRNHRVTALTAGFELVPRPGALRLELSGLHGRVLPRTGYNESVINDAEDSRGGGVRITATDARQRLMVDAGYSRSTFGNPADALLSQGEPLVPVRRETRGAQYLDVSYKLIDRTAPERLSKTLAAAYRHERVEPLFASVGTAVRADLQQDTVELTGALGQATAQITYTHTGDNLDDIESILTTLTRVAALNAVVPLASLSKRGAKMSLPSLTYELNRTHQFGEAVPVNSDFSSVSQIPDQVSTNHTVGLEWQKGMVKTGYRYNRSFQDNRQEGRILADLLNLANTISGSVTPNDRFDVAGEFAFESAENRELTQTDITRRIGLNTTWRLTRRTTLAGVASTTFLRDKRDTKESRATEFNLEMSQSFPFTTRPSGKPAAQLFVRFARQDSRLLDAVFGTNDRRRTWTLNSGVTISLF